MGISEQSTLLCEQKLLISRQIFRYAVYRLVPSQKALFSSAYERRSPRRWARRWSVCVETMDREVVAYQ